MSSQSKIVSKLWNLCNILRDDGITYHQYLGELTSLVFLKMAEEAGAEEQIPVGCRWAELRSAKGEKLLTLYRGIISKLANARSSDIQAAFARARSEIDRASSLEALVRGIDDADWFSARKQNLGDIYEGLLEKNATEKKSGAGQYFTPRPLVESIVSLIKPKIHETIQDPAAGTAGFLVAAHQWAAHNSSADTRANKSPRGTYVGVELVPDVHRLGMMNLLLHDLKADFKLGDTLGDLGPSLPKSDVILANPPFGSKKGNAFARTDLLYSTTNKQFAFLQHIISNMKEDGRAAVVLPDNILFETGKGAGIRRLLMDTCNLHTILRLPNGLFYSPGVKTNVLFFSKVGKRVKPTERVWVYDLRTAVHAFGRTRPFRRDHLAEFESAFGADPYGGGPREDGGELGRFRSFSRAEIADRGDSLDMRWLSPSEPSGMDDPGVHLETAITALQSAIGQLERLLPARQDNRTK